jgi:putative PEP-CTERM system histidine kinase
MMVGTMGIRKAALLLPDGEGGYRVADSVGGIRADSLVIERESPLVVAGLAQQGSPLTLDTVAPDDPLAGAVMPFRAEGLTLLVPLAVREEVLGLLAVGPPAGSPITHEDEELLITVAAQTGSALLNARLAEQLAAARELEALNRVASFLLHDLKNCVSMLSLVAQNAETVGADPAFQRDAFKTVGESIRKMRVLIERLSHLPKGLELRLVAVDLNGLVSEIVGQARLATNAAVRLVTSLDPLPLISADPEQVRKVLDNLLLNAIEAVRDEGEVRVRTTTGRGSVSLEVSDNGPGIPGAILRRGLFLPFQTTKPHGLGIGLFQVKSIVEAHGGQVHVVSREGKGTAVRVEFPFRQ